MRVLDKKSVVEINPKKMSGSPVFYGTRVPIQNLFDEIESGATIDEFLSGYSTVKKEQVIELLEEAKHNLCYNSTK